MDDLKDRVLFCGNLAENVTEELLSELFLQAGPLQSVKIPKEKSGKHKNFAFITFKHEMSVAYAVALFKGIYLYGKELQLDFRTGTGFVPNKYLDILMNYRSTISFQEEVIFQRSPDCNPGIHVNDPVYLSNLNSFQSSERLNRSWKFEMNRNNFDHTKPNGTECGSHIYREEYLNPDSKTFENRMKDSRRPSDRHRQSPYMSSHSRIHNKSNEFPINRRR